MNSKQQISELQIELDSIAYRLIKSRRLMIIQSICDFNIFFLDSISPLINREETIEFITEHMKKFKRKISLKEYIRFDSIIYHLNPKDFDEFSKIVKE